MVEIAIMIEGQNGLNWDHWKKIARAVEDLGFAGIYRSDHFTNASGPDLDSLELWVSLAWLAGNTRRIEFGPLVTPFSFRDPVFTARMAKDVDDLSGGRLTLGLGAGWQQREHDKFGYRLQDRFERFAEGIEVVHRLLNRAEPVSFEGRFYQLREASLLPPPRRPGGPPILVGGTGRNRTLPLAAPYAKEWNAIFLTPARFAELNERLDELLGQQGRRPEEVRRSMMTGLIFARSGKALQVKLAERGRSAEELAQRGLIVGTPDQIGEQIQGYGEVGLQRMMLQWLDLQDLEGLEALAEAVL